MYLCPNTIKDQGREILPERDCPQITPNTDPQHMQSNWWSKTMAEIPAFTHSRKHTDMTELHVFEEITLKLLGFYFGSSYKGWSWSPEIWIQDLTLSQLHACDIGQVSELCWTSVSSLAKCNHYLTLTYCIGLSGRVSICELTSSIQYICK